MPFTQENPLSIAYIKLYRSFLWSIGLWPGEHLGEIVPLFFRCHRVYIPVQAGFILIGQVLYLYKYIRVMSFYVMGHCIISTILGVATVVRGTLPNLKEFGMITKEFLFSFHLTHFKHKGKYCEKVCIIVDKVSYYFTVYMLVMMISGLVLYNISPLYQNIKISAFTGNRQENSTLSFSVYYSFYGFEMVDWFYFTTILNFYLSYNCGILMCSIDLHLTLMIFQIIGHIQILRDDLKNIPRPKRQLTDQHVGKNGVMAPVIVEMYDAEENKYIRILLTECIKRHRMIVSFTDRISEFFGPLLGLNYFNHLVSCCLLLLECSTGDIEAIIGFGALTMIIFGQLIQISTIFEVVGSMSEKIPDSVYDIPWECMDTKNRRTMGIFLHRVQTPIQVHAMGLTVVGVQTMAKILKTTFSYYAFLRTFD